MDLSVLYPIKVGHPIPSIEHFWKYQRTSIKSEQGTPQIPERDPKLVCLGISIPATRKALDLFAHSLGRNEKTLFWSTGLLSHPEVLKWDIFVQKRKQTI